jgi:hypothetical protein
MITSRPFASRFLSFAGAVALLVLAAFVPGCSHKYSGDPASSEVAGPAGELLAPRPTDTGIGFSSARMLYPLAVGNRWDYRVRERDQITTEAGPQPPVIREQPLALEITDTQTFDGRQYFLQSEFDPRQGPANGSVFNLRGSRFGLFELDLVRAPQGVATDAVPIDPEATSLAAYVDRTIADPAQRAAFQRAAAEVVAKLAAVRPSPGSIRPGTDAAPGEITLLSYPLYAGARWIVRDDPRFARIVIGRERVSLPLGTFAAWNIRGTAELFGPEDRVHFWYSNLGLLRIRFHVVGNATDNTGAIIGRVVTDSDQSLTDIHLVAGDAALVARDGVQQ